MAEEGFKKSSLRDTFESLVVTVILAVFGTTFVVQAFKIPSGSMIPTLDIGDHLLVNKFLYGTKIPFRDVKIMPIRQPERGDIIVFKYPEDESRDFIKRVIGVAGDRIEISPLVVALPGRGGELPSQAHIQRQPPRDFPIVLQEKALIQALIRTRRRQRQRAQRQHAKPGRLARPGEQRLLPPAR